MKFGMHFLQPGIRHVGVDLRGRNRGVAQEFLDGSDVGPIGQKRRSERVAERMGGNVFHNPGSQGSAGHHAGNEVPGQTDVGGG